MNALAYDPEKWPHGWLLPVTRREGNPIDKKNHGVIIHHQGQPIPAVFLINLLDICHPGDLAHTARLLYPNLHLLLCDWRVD